MSATASQGEHSPRGPACPDDAGERLDRGVGDAEQDARGGAEEDAVVLVTCPELGGQDEQACRRRAVRTRTRPSPRGVMGVRAAGVGERERQQDEADGHEPHAHVLAPADLKPKQRSARTVSRTTPPEMTVWTTEIGASAMAAT